jgi:hypothetical protein
VFAWIMILGGLALGFLFLALAVFPFHPKPGRVMTAAGYRHFCLQTAYLCAWASVLGAGLRTRLPWSWHGTIAILLTFAFIGLMVPVIAATLRNAKPSGASGALILGSVLCAPSVLFLWQLFRPGVRAALGIPEAPPPWIRVLAMSHLTGAGLIFLGVLNPTPRALFGVWKNRELLLAYLLLSGFLWIWIGRGLYRYRESARRWAIGFGLITAAEYCCFTMIGPATPGQLYVRGLRLFVWVVISALTVWYLHTRRRWFSRPITETLD